MKTDERLDRLVVRHEALSQSVEMLFHSTQELRKSTEETRKSVEELRKNAKQQRESIDDVLKGIASLAKITGAHEMRISKLEGR